MSLDTVDKIIAGMQPPREIVKQITPTLVAGRPHSLFQLGGVPPAADAFPAVNTIAGAACTSLAGQIPYMHSISVDKESRLARFQAAATIPGNLLLCDRLWQNVIPCAWTTGVMIFSGAVQIPPRDWTGSAYGYGVMAGIEVNRATGSGTPTLLLGYTNHSGVAARSSTNQFGTVATSAIGAFYPIGLQDNDEGIQKAESLKLSATWTSGFLSAVLYRVLARLELAGPYTPNAVDALTGGFTKLFPGTVPFLIFIPNTTTASYINGHVVWSQG
jgi:hypothetical protein